MPSIARVGGFGRSLASSRSSKKREDEGGGGSPLSAPSPARQQSSQALRDHPHFTSGNPFKRPSLTRRTLFYSWTVFNLSSHTKPTPQSLCHHEKDCATDASRAQVVSPRWGCVPPRHGDPALHCAHPAFTPRFPDAPPRSKTDAAGHARYRVNASLESWSPGVYVF